MGNLRERRKGKMMINLTDTEKQTLKENLIKFVNRVTEDPDKLNPNSRPTPAEYEILPAIIDQLRY